MNKPRAIDVDKVCNDFTYDAKTGVLTRTSTGETVGRNKQGRLVCEHDGREQKVHRLCWVCYHRKDIGDKVIDHINRDPLDNRISNLRVVSSAENTANKKGLCIERRRNKWRGRIRSRGKRISVGWYDCPLMAGLAVIDMKKELKIIPR